MVLKANDRRTSCPCHDEFRRPRSDYVRQVALATTTTTTAPAIFIYNPNIPGMCHSRLSNSFKTMEKKNHSNFSWLQTSYSPKEGRGQHLSSVTSSSKLPVNLTNLSLNRINVYPTHMIFIGIWTPTHELIETTPVENFRPWLLGYSRLKNNQLSIDYATRRLVYWSKECLIGSFITSF
ncbi:hypothetical protein TNCV_2022821 [Trichonephila clavipes]|nr:hypothetical protein TNCV_2022821 [Trichonephila clavipes]